MKINGKMAITVTTAMATTLIKGGKKNSYPTWNG
jgi:hypothetical protein